MPKIGKLKYLLVILDHLKIVWMLFLPSAMAGNVIKIILEQIIPWFDIVENIDSDNGVTLLPPIQRMS
jgi:hypothetical protein